MQAKEKIKQIEEATLKFQSAFRVFCRHVKNKEIDKLKESKERMQQAGRYVGEICQNPLTRTQLKALEEAVVFMADRYKHYENEETKNTVSGSDTDHNLDPNSNHPL